MIKKKRSVLAGGEGDEKKNSHTKHKVRISDYKKYRRDHEAQKKSEKISLVCISFRRLQGGEMKK